MGKAKIISHTMRTMDSWTYRLSLKKTGKNHRYHCISCGAEMIAKLGKKNIHHFAHKGGDDSCNTETYLHKLGKYLLRRKFEESGEFLIKYGRTSKCSRYDTCDFCKEYECTRHLDTPIDLKRYFDTCTEEQADI